MRKYKLKMTHGRLDSFRDTLKEIVDIKNGIQPEDCAEDISGSEIISSMITHKQKQVGGGSSERVGNKNDASELKTININISKEIQGRESHRGRLQTFMLKNKDSLRSLNRP